ncbi:MAG TPA: lipoyl(octanoyl) transferase LipB [Woeseiaceae bacterium]|jgi:lipoyl(octanoyl) transferase|nr:lipoyl(octanoyl) transferase LipB [Woeseiaceae bacterium]
MKTRFLGRQDYVPLWHEMQAFTNERDESTPDEIWFCEHPPVFTLGLNAAKEHVLAAGNIPVVQIDRGGQVTYHGPGMLMIYPLIDIKRAGIGVRKLVTALEQSVVDLLAEFDIDSAAKSEAPGVYVDEKKIASVGLRIRRGASFHGMALNVDGDLEPFARINPCGFENLEMVDMRGLGIELSLEDTADRYLPHFLKHLDLL